MITASQLCGHGPGRNLHGPASFGIPCCLYGYVTCVRAMDIVCMCMRSMSYFEVLCCERALVSAASCGDAAVDMRTCVQVEQLTGLSSSLTSLALRPNPRQITADNVWHLAGMSQLQDLSICPLPEVCTAPDLQQLLEMPHLTRLQLGTSNAAQVIAVCAGQSTGADGRLLDVAARTVKSTARWATARHLDVSSSCTWTAHKKKNYSAQCA